MPAPNRWVFFSRLFVVCGLFLFLSLILRPGLSSSTPATVVSKSVKQPDEPSLRGEAAIKHLQEQGTYQSLQAAVNQAQYDVLWRDQTPVKGLASGAFEATNPKQKFATWFTGDGIVMQPAQSADSNWEFQFKLDSLGYGAAQHPVGPGNVSAELSKVENARLAAGITKLTEWYINRPEGLEQGITIEAPPAQRVPGERMRLGFRVAGDLIPQLEDSSAINFNRKNGTGTALRYDQLYVTDSTGNDVPAQFAVEGGKVWIEVDDAQAVYPINIDPTFALPFKLVGPTPLGAGGSVAVYGNTAVVGTIGNRVFVYVQDMAGAWTLQATLTPSDTSTPADFGIDVTMYGNTIAVGAFLQGPGRVYIFNRTGTTWSETQILTNPDLEPGAWFGYSVAMNVDTLAVGSEWSAGPNNNDQGAAFIYVRSGGVWTLQQKLVASDGASGDNLGYEIDVWGDYVVVGAPKNASINSQSGAAYVFVRTGTTWNQQAKLIDPQGNGADLFGVCVSINGDTIAVGSNEGDSATGQFENTGSAVVFVRNGSTWTVQQRFIPPSGSVVPLGFGIGVCVYGNRLVIGSPSEIVGSFTDHGACYVYSRSGSVWTLDSRLIPADGETLSLFGESIAMQGETLVIGSIGDTIGAQQGYGSAYVYSTCDWMQQAKNINSDGAASDNLGSSIAVSGSTVIVGAENDDVDAANDNRGSASVFVRSGTTWTRQAVLTASDRANGDLFGTSVAIEGDTAVVGARLGPGGTSADQGAAYVFVRSAGVWSQQARLNGSDSTASDEFGRSVSISGQTVVVGAPLGPGTNSADQGAAYVFTRSGVTWTQQQKLSAGSDGAAGDQFGFAVDVNLNTAIVGANSDDFPGQTNQGSAYVFFRTGTTWAQQQKFTGSDSLANDNFGVSVALSNETAIVGADRDDIGANADQGSAFVFVRSGSTWSQQQKLTGSDGTANNQFGAGVDIDGERAVIGARFGRNAVPLASGSVYIFGRAENLWFQQKTLVANDGAANDEFAGCVALDDNYIATGARADDVGANADQGSSYVFVLECPTCPYIPAVLTGTRTICVGQSATITVYIEGGVGPFSNVTLSNGGGTQSGSGPFTFTVSPTSTTAYSIIGGTDGNGCPISGLGSVLITFGSSPTAADAGLDQTICITGTAQLNGNNPAPQTGMWSVASGPSTANSQFNNVNLRNAIFDPDLAGTYVLQWSIPSPPCSPSTDTVTILVRPTPTTANAGSPQTICSNGSATLNGNAPGVGTGMWSVVSGPSTDNNQLLLPANRNAIFTPSGGAGSYVLRWTISNPPCADSTSDVTITVDPAATVDAGANQTVCDTSPTVTLAGVIGGSATSATWSGGGGTFNPNTTTLNATYTPSLAEITAGTVTLTLTTNDPAGQCVAVSDTVTITINRVPVVDAGPAQAICSGSTVTLAGSITGSVTTGTWSGGGGTFSPNNRAFNAVYTPTSTEISTGSVTLTLTSDAPSSPCLAVSDTVTITINPAATVDAGVNRTVCEDNPSVTLAGVIGGGASSATWSGGGGTFNPNTTTLNATYTPSSAEITAGSVTLTLTTNDPTGPCPAVSDTLTITINKLPVVDAGPPQTICGGSTVTLAGSVTGSATTGNWSGGGGTFSPNASTLNAVYTPSPAEVLAGTVTLTLTSGVPPAPCGTVSDTVTITINQAATVDAGVNQTVCEDSPTVTLAGVIGGSATSATWTGGTGTFNPNTTTLNASYTPSSAEITTGTVTLTLTTNDPTGPCPAVFDTVIITINKLPVVDAGLAQTICAGQSVTLAGSVTGTATTGTWAGGGGTFNPDRNALNAVYTPSAAETSSGSVILTLVSADPAGPCGPVSDTVAITINPAATVEAGGPFTVCADNPSVSLIGLVGGGASTGTWSGGAGSFNPNNTTLATVYTPSAGEIAAGTVTLTLTTNDPTGPCPAVFDTVTITINPLPVVEAGNPQTICAGSTVTLAGSVTGPVTTGTWSGGGGTFSPNNATLNAVYTPSSGEVTAGTVILTLTSADPAGPCGTVSDTVTITINQAATVEAGNPQTVCASSPTIVLNGSIGGSAVSATWSGGSGTFSPNTTTLNASYTPSAGEIAAGTVTLTLTTNDPAGPCPAVFDTVTFTINPLPVVDAGNPQTICEGTSALLTGSITGPVTTGTWTGGTGTFTPNATTLNASYTPSLSEITAGTVTLTLTSADPAGPCAAVSDTVTITINRAATVDAGLSQTVCADNPVVPLAGVIGGSAVSATWSGGSGTFSPNTTTLNASYTPSAGEIAAGTVILTLTTNDPAGPCPAVFDTMTITINQIAVVEAGNPQTICEGTSAPLTGSVTGAVTTGTWTGGTGTFAPNATTLNASYTPSMAEILAGSVTLTLTSTDPTGPCPAVSDMVTITINRAATVEAGLAQMVCADNANIQLAGTFGGGATSVTWSGGAGTFVPNAATPTAIYLPTPAEIAGGGVTLTLTTNDPAGPCPAVSDTVTITIFPVATVNAGTDQQVCATTPSVVLAGSTGGSAISAIWSGGTGTFVPNTTTLTATYTPSVAEIAAGTVTLTLTTNDPTGPCSAVFDTMTITIDPAATVAAGPDQEVCVGLPIQLAGAIGGAATLGTWSGGGGTFTPNATTPTAVYTPTAGEVAAGTVTLTLTTNDPAGLCGPVSDSVTITIVTCTELSTLYVADTFNNRVQKFDGVNWTVIGNGAGGSSPGQFLQPEAVTASIDGQRIYVADTGNSRIQWSQNGGLTWTMFASSGTGLNQVKGPQGLALDVQGNLYVADTLNGRILRFNGGVPGAARVLSTTGSGTGQVRSPRGLAIDTTFNLFVADQMNSRVIRIPNANTTTTANTGSVLASSGTALSQVRNPQGVAVDNLGNLYVADTGNSRILVFAGGVAGTATQFCGVGTNLGQVRDPEGITVSLFAAGDLNGISTVIISDTTNNRIQGRPVAGGDWELIGTPNGLGTGVGQFRTPSKIR